MASEFVTSNLLLSRLGDEDVAVLQPYLTKVSLSEGDVLTTPFEPVEFVYFLENGIASVVSDLNDRAEAQIGMIGREGMTGTSVVLGVDSTPFRTCLHVGKSSAWRVGVDDLFVAMRQSTALKTTFQHYAHVAAVQAAESAAVNASFDIPRRIARFLLMCHDRVPSDALAVTHQLIGRLLDVRRPGVSVALKSFEDAGAIECERGIIVVGNREWLRGRAGNAYGTAEAEYGRLLGPFGKSGSSVQRRYPSRQAQSGTRMGDGHQNSMTQRDGLGS